MNATGLNVRSFSYSSQWIHSTGQVSMASSIKYFQTGIFDFFFHDLSFLLSRLRQKMSEGKRLDV
jgi:hypothetical protein